jgi:hypothetical protein
MQRPISRRQLLQQLGVIAAGVGAACTPMRVLVNAYPQAFDDDPALTERVLRAFTITVIPGAPALDADLTRAFVDADYPFAPFAAFFASDLDRRGRERYGEAFEQLDPAARTTIIADGLAADATTRKLYNGAIALAQIAFYAGIYDDRRGCILIGFEGGYRWHPLTEITHPHPTRFLAEALTPDGNYA